MNRYPRHRKPGPRPLTALLIGFVASIIASLFTLTLTSPAHADPVPVPAPTFHDNGDVSPSDQDTHPELTYGFDGDFVFVTHGPACADSLNKIVFVTVGDLGEGNEPSYQVSEGGSEFLTISELKSIKRLDLAGLDLDTYTGGWYRIYPVGSDTCGERPKPEVPVTEEPDPQVLPNVGAADGNPDAQERWLALGLGFIVGGIWIRRAFGKTAPRH